jgi:hypothetical protein
MDSNIDSAVGVGCAIAHRQSAAVTCRLQLQRRRTAVGDQLLLLLLLGNGLARMLGFWFDPGFLAAGALL